MRINFGETQADDMARRLFGYRLAEGIVKLRRPNQTEHSDHNRKEFTLSLLAFQRIFGSFLRSAGIHAHCISAASERRVSILLSLTALSGALPTQFGDDCSLEIELQHA